MEKTYSMMQEQKNEIQLFTNEVFGNVRVTNIENVAWFIGKEIVEALGYDLTGNSYTVFVKRYCDEDDVILLDKNSSTLHTSVFDYKQLGQRGGYLINEYALYDLVLQSPLPQAKQFKRWVTHVVLPQIRKTGGYIPINSQDTEETIKAKAEAIAKETTKHYEDLIAQQQKYINYLEQDIKEADEVIDVLKNDVKYLFNDTDFGVHSISEAYTIVSHTVNGQRNFVKWFKEHNELVEVIDIFIDDDGSKIKNAIDLSDINNFHYFKDLVLEYSGQQQLKR